MTWVGVPCHLVMFVVVYSFDYIDLPRLRVEVRGDIGHCKRSSQWAMFHFQESKMQATRLVSEHNHLADYLSKQKLKTYHSPKAHD